ncbi:D-alanine--D-alanine ligase [Flavobacterium sp. T12S277]|uniref:D-alanine--D-alanine ligase n=1 Tax=Flavobacterium sp. T12S277 TaxID=3402752 RepID=UPI003AE52874
MKLFLHKISSLKYWPFQILYIPIYFLLGFYAFKAKAIFFFNASNPAIRNGGFIMNSKKAIYDMIPQKYYPKTILIKEKTSLAEIVSTIKNKRIQFPLIAKPDIGLKGRGVEKIKSVTELKKYKENANFDFLLQDMIPFENQIEIFYVRYPSMRVGKITGIATKEILIVTGDGISTIDELINEIPRSKRQMKILPNGYKKKLKEVLEEGEQRDLVLFGNHFRRANFLDVSHWISPKLSQTINTISAQIPEFYFGRFDIMYNNLEELERGENFSIVELNGAVSKPNHIYDPKHSVWFAWKELARHITYMYEISVLNNQKGVPYLACKVGINQYRLHLAQRKKIAKFKVTYFLNNQIKMYNG